jgi:sugar phosphate isomerase/epimerase
MTDISVHVHSFSLRYHLRYRDISNYDVFSYFQDMKNHGFTGVNVSANGTNYRDLCGTSDSHFAAVRESARQLGLALELDTSDTRIENMTRMIEVAAACGADTLRTYTKYSGELNDIIEWTIRDLRLIAPIAEKHGVMVVLENHEDFTGPVLAHILGAVDHPMIRALYDYGNSQMVGEDPLIALQAMAPFITRVHAKDHVLLQSPDGPVVQGVPFGSGRLPLKEITRALYEAGVRRFCYENVWSYTAPIKCAIDALPSTPCFTWDDPSRYLRGDTLQPVDAIAQEKIAFDLGLQAFWDVLEDCGYRIQKKQ